MPRQARRRQHVVHHPVPPAGQRRHQTPIGIFIRPQRRCRYVHGSIGSRGGAIVKRVSKRNSGMNQFQPMFRQRQRSKEGDTAASAWTVEQTS